jgi:hypothetical protein
VRLSEGLIKGKTGKRQNGKSESESERQDGKAESGNGETGRLHNCAE